MQDIKKQLCGGVYGKSLHIPLIFSCKPKDDKKCRIY